MRMRALCAVVLFAGCPHSYRGVEPPTAPERPVPIEGVNSPFDDFNSADMRLFTDHRFAFSSNRGSQGAHLDIYEVQLHWSEDKKLVAVTEPVVFAPTLMSDRDERGPVAFSGDDWDNSYSASRLVWASNREGSAGFDLYSIACGGNWHPHRGLPCGDDASTTPELVPLAGLNSPRDDAYLSVPFAPRRVLFSSNRDSGDAASMTAMDIYTATWPEKATLAEAPSVIARVAELSSDADDSAPYVWRSRDRSQPVEMVFVSDRAGGQGEHDIYCSRFDATSETWSAPNSLGATINSEKDEYRPIVFEINQTRFLVFSSTRDGGQGGYDLYVVGYPGCH